MVAVGLLAHIAYYIDKCVNVLSRSTLAGVTQQANVG